MSSNLTCDFFEVVILSLTNTTYKKYNNITILNYFQKVYILMSK